MKFASDPPKKPSAVSFVGKSENVKENKNIKNNIRDIILVLVSVIFLFCIIDKPLCLK